MTNSGLNRLLEILEGLEQRIEHTLEKVQGTESIDLELVKTYGDIREAKALLQIALESDSPKSFFNGGSKLFDLLLKIATLADRIKDFLEDLF